ncbi:MAG: hypothetical protein P0Y65_15920 [Candidatus Devosia phytovorans]|uniref:Uncharacterized protein n=1 Tax=Candidatus Devosia phytovorans TaxID=3121372 RepID=A0AAJ5VUL3_9HYPH|nr:hypothetical protein [Devosia sp.]WEK03664.1 MAG: hypothetical protein P0Y65_15920 [Devosia sp.]
MDPRQKQKRQDEVRQPAQTPIADAIAIGTAAGGLVLGTMLAQAMIPETQDAQTSHDTGLPADAAQITVSPAVLTDTAAGADPVAQPAPEAVQPVPLAAGPAPLPDANATPLQDHLVSELSQQMAGTIGKVMQGAEPGVTAADFSQSIASDIIQSAQDIVARLDIGAMLAETQGLGDSILAQVNAPGIVAEILGGTAGLADSILTGIAPLPGEILGDTLASLADLPSSLLGNEGMDGPDGLLSAVFYSDGASDSLSIPDLSSAASSTVASLVDGPVGLLGLSYVDTSDHQGGHGLNALSLL